MLPSKDEIKAKIIEALKISDYDVEVVVQIVQSEINDSRGHIKDAMTELQMEGTIGFNKYRQLSLIPEGRYGCC